MKVHTSSYSGSSVLKVPQTMPSMPGHEMMSPSTYQSLQRQPRAVLLCNGELGGAAEPSKCFPVHSFDA
eukprot:4941101-Amphidinium_carterae.1